VSLLENELKELKNFYIPDKELTKFIDKTRSESGNLETVPIPQDAKLWKINYLYATFGEELDVTVLPKQEKEHEKI